MPETRNPAALVAVMLAVALTQASGQLRVDFNSTNQDGGPHLLTGFQSYNAAHEVAADFTAARSYTAFGTTVTLRATFPDSADSADARTMQMIDRGATADLAWQGAWVDLLTDWIGVDTRTENGGRGDYNGTTGNPTRMMLRLGNLPAGNYTWRSYHHDTDNQNGNFAVQLSTNGGTSFTPIGTYEITCSRLASEDPVQTGVSDPDPRNLSSTVQFPITATAGNDVVVSFIPLSASDLNQRFFVCNGIEVFDPANPPPGPPVNTPQPAGSYSLDFSTAGSPLKPGFAGVAAAYGATATINGTSFQLLEASQNLQGAYRPAVADELLSDFVYNPGTQSNAGIVVRVTGLPAGEYVLESWHYDSNLTAGAIQIEKRAVGGASTILVDQHAYSQTPAIVPFTSDGSVFEFVTRNDSTQNTTRWNGLRITNQSLSARPITPWVFRGVMENRTRMLVAALHPQLWLSFDPGNCCIDRAWAGGMQFHGKVYPDFSQKNSWVGSALYHRFPNAIFEATDEAAFPAGWAVTSGSVSYNIAQALTDSQKIFNPLRDKRPNSLFGFTGTTTVTTGTLDLSRHAEATLFFEEKHDTGTNWNLLASSGTMRVQVSEDNGATWTSQDFFSTDTAVTPNQFNYKQIISRSPTTKLRFTGQGGQYANLTLEGEYQGWTATSSGSPVAVHPNWLGYRTLNRDEAVTLRYQLRLPNNTNVLVEETPEALPQASGPPKLERRMAVSGIPAGTVVSLRMSGDPAWSAFAESWSHSGAGSLRNAAGVTYLDLAADGTAVLTSTWMP